MENGMSIRDFVFGFNFKHPVGEDYFSGFSHIVALAHKQVAEQIMCPLVGFH